MTQEELIASLPLHLRPFVKTQDYENYTARDHAVWRFVMRGLTRQLTDSAHPVYLEGLARTGISLDHIPSINEMNRCLEQLGWRAVVVDGFIPPAIFMEFQSLRILVIALDMRSVEQIFYTPAPDIVHESSGHAPFLVDIDYAEFLQRFGEVGLKAIATKRDLEHYEAVRQLSILKACPESSDSDIAAAEAHLAELSADDAAPSEATLLTRLHWWTVEYGLVGEVDNYRIFGAGLLSSLGESQRCLDDRAVNKLPLTVNAVSTPYDITREQPQLFVTKSCKHLCQVLEEFAESMCFKRGGRDAIQTAIEAESICTAVYNTGVQVSGVFSDVLCDAVGNATYIKTTGPTQIAFDDIELRGHGVSHHSDGFGSPIGYLKNFSRCLSEYTIDELKAHDIAIGERACLEYLSGITIEGRLERVERQNHRNLVLSFSSCSVVDLEGRVLFDPSWGIYDLAVGARIGSVYGGVADREALQLFKPTPATDTIHVTPDKVLMAAYAAAHTLASRAHPVSLQELGPQLLETLASHPEEWLLRVELMANADTELREMLGAQLTSITDRDHKLDELIEAILRAK